MNSPLPRQVQVGGRRPTRPPSYLHSDCPPEEHGGDADGSPTLGQRSLSLTTLQPTIIQPRMAQLETLEAKMASIEVSLSSTPRRKKNGLMNSLSGSNLVASMKSIPKEMGLKELENLRCALRDKENIIQNLKGQLGVPGLRLAQIRASSACSNGNIVKELSENERKQAEDRLGKLRTETDNKRLAIKNLKMALERLDISDNIDVRIQQAELEYQLGREELNLLTLLEETRTLQLCLEEFAKNSTDSHTLYRCINEADHTSLHGVEIMYDSKSPRFGAGTRDSTPGLWVDWALDDTGIRKGDRLIEVNGKIVLNKSRDDLIRLLSADPDPARIVLLRNHPKEPNVQEVKPDLLEAPYEITSLRSELGVVRERAEEAQRAKTGLISDNIRLTHRISYLEEQVSELLGRKNPDVVGKSKGPVVTSMVKTSQNVTNINISSANPVVTSPNGSLNDLQIFQKGPQVTALVANLPGLDVSKESHTSLPVRSRSSLSNVSNTHIPAPSPQSDYSYHKSHRHRNRVGRHPPVNKDVCQDIQPKPEKDYYSETGSNRELARKEDQQRTLMDQSYKKAAMIVHDLTKNREENYDKHRQKCISASEKYNTQLLKHYNTRKSASVLDFRTQAFRAPENGESRRKLQESRSIKSLDFSDKLDYASEPLEHHYHPGTYVENIRPRPTPPKKPLRLSLHKSQSLQSVETAEKIDSRKPMKRNHKGESHKVPIFNVKVEDGPGRHDLQKSSSATFKWTSFAPGQ